MLVGISGAAGAGKDTCAAALIEHLQFEKGSFALPLKQLVCTLFGWTPEQLENRGFKESSRPEAYGLTPRELLQTLGTDWGRKLVNENLWVDRALAGLSEHKDHVFSDVRFPNEARAVRSRGGLLIHITCRDRATDTNSTTHSSEAWVPWLALCADAHIEADFGQIEQLQSAVVNTVCLVKDGHLRVVEPSGDRLEELNKIEQEILARLN